MENKIFKRHFFLIYSSIVIYCFCKEGGASAETSSSSSPVVNLVSAALSQYSDFVKLKSSASENTLGM
jgi:hypothetical protein